MEGSLFVKFLFNWLLFYTTINIFLVVFHKYTSKYVDVLLSSLIVAFVSFGITYIHPREVRMEVDTDHTYIVHTYSFGSLAIDFAMHWVPLIYVLIFVPITNKGSNGYRQIFLTFVMVMSYMLIVNAQKLYNFDMNISILFVILAVIVRFAIRA